MKTHARREQCIIGETRNRCGHPIPRLQRMNANHSPLAVITYLNKMKSSTFDLYLCTLLSYITSTCELNCCVVKCNNGCFILKEIMA